MKVLWRKNVENLSHDIILCGNLDSVFILMMIFGRELRELIMTWIRVAIMYYLTNDAGIEEFI